MKLEARRTVREAGVYVYQGIVNLTIADFGRRCVVTGLANLHIVQCFVHDVGKSRLADCQSDQAGTPRVFALEAVDCNLREPMGLPERAGPA